MRLRWRRDPKPAPKKREREPQRRAPKQQVHPEIERATSTGLGVWFPPGHPGGEWLPWTFE